MLILAAKIILYRLTATSDTKDNTTDKVEFDGTDQESGKYNHVIDYKTIMSLVAQENPLPDSNNPNPLQDTGLATMTFEIQGYFDETGNPTGDYNPTWAIEKMRDWLRQDKTNSDYTFGRFGITNTLRPEYDVEPDHDTDKENGLILEHFELNQDYEFIGKTGFICRFRFNGTISRLGE